MVEGHYEYTHDIFAATLWASTDRHVFSPCAASIVDRVRNMLSASEALGTCRSLPIPPPRLMQIVTEHLLPSLAVDPEGERRQAQLECARETPTKASQQLGALGKEG